MRRHSPMKQTPVDWLSTVFTYYNHNTSLPKHRHFLYSLSLSLSLSLFQVGND
jgi:hypothetical protein